MTQEELNKIVEQHQHWIKEDCEGWEDMRANLEGAYQQATVTFQIMTNKRSRSDGRI